jgi:hypothetical protein
MRGALHLCTATARWCFDRQQLTARRVIFYNDPKPSHQIAREIYQAMSAASMYRNRALVI